MKEINKIFFIFVLLFLNISSKLDKMKDFEDLTLEEKLGQLLVIGFHEPVLTDEVRALIRKYKFGNFILFARNVVDLPQLEKLTRDIYEEVMDSIGIMPFIAIDQEGGNTVRIMDKLTFYPGSMTLAATDLSNAETIGHMMGKHLISLGINMNFAPVLDINNNPKNPIIGIRSYSDKPEIVSKYGIEVMKGMKSEGVIATVKHFPGHGDVEIDSHLGLPKLPFDKERLYNMELKPFIDAINNDVQNIMAAHIVFQEVDEENPATVSKDILKGILRDELKYTGLITSDCMEMKAISKTITTPGGVLKGIQAGDDLVLVSHTKQLQIDSANLLKLSIGDKSLSIEEIDEKVKRILKYKNEVYSIMNKKFFNNPDNLEIFNDESQGEILQNIVDSSLTFVNGKKLELKGKTLIYWSQQFASTIAEDILNGDNMGDLLNKEIPSADTLEYIANQYSKKLVKEAKIYDTVVFISFNAFSYKNQTKMINEINDICSNFYVISIRNPYDYLYLNQSINYYTLYESTPNSMRTVVKFLKGKIDATGKLPVTLSFN
jgi:beta-N-acetylhexosaminidase